MFFLFNNVTHENLEVKTSAAEKKDFEKLQEVVRDYEIWEGFLYINIKRKYGKNILKNEEKLQNSLLGARQLI
ncbi:MAG: hypothetical protein NZ519_00280 [Bacteroidia bacterium]|nr:hypothetical protein [Bacteroidia bacterium]